MASEFQEAAALYLSVLSMRDHVLEMFRQGMAQLEQAQEAVAKEHPSADPEMVAGLTQQTAMYKSDMEVLNAIYGIARSEVVEILNTANAAQGDAADNKDKNPPEQ